MPYENLRRIRKIGRKEGKRESNYHRRSLAETQVFRFKKQWFNIRATKPNVIVGTVKKSTAAICLA
jgi:hypothetical protein